MKSIIFLLFPVLVFHSNLFAQNSTERAAPETVVETQAQPVEQNNTSTSVGVKQAPPVSKTIDHTKTPVMEQTLSIIKPDAVLNRHIGDIIVRLENKGLFVIGLKMTQLTPQQAGQFYKIHREKPFYSDLVASMSSGPIVVMVLEGENAIARTRKIMGATDPEKAGEGTIRGKFAQSITKNAIHGSDSPETAQEEIRFFFEKDQIFPRDL